jgi:hypothetical protein
VLAECVAMSNGSLDQSWEVIGKHGAVIRRGKVFLQWLACRGVASLRKVRGPALNCSALKYACIRSFRSAPTRYRLDIASIKSSLGFAC